MDGRLDLIHMYDIIIVFKSTKSSAVNLSAFIYRLFHEEFSSIILTNIVFFSDY